MVNLGALWRKAAALLQQAGIEDAAFDARELCRMCCGADPLCAPQAPVSEAARRRLPPAEALDTQRSQDARRQIQERLEDAIRAEANPFVPVRLTYDEFRQRHGDLIFGGGQPKRALDAAAAKLAPEGYFLTTGIQIARQNRKYNGFLLQVGGE